MCINKKWIKNPYNGHHYFVSCGKCPACQQEKANRRTARIKNHLKDGDLAFFCTLTYDNDNIPYVLRSDLEAGVLSIPVYRNCKVRRVRCSSDYRMTYKRYDGVHVVTNVEVDPKYYKNFDSHQFKTIKKFYHDGIGVIYYADIQNFFKRLKQNLQRRYNYDIGKLSYFSCSELGPTTGRPHFHLLLFAPANDEQLLRMAVNEAWPFNDCSVADIQERKFEVAKDAASYVSSYVNRGASFPNFFTQNSFRPKHSYSQGFGISNKHFTLDSVLKKARERNLTYPIPIVGEKFAVRNIPLPYYVINRYFPKFKGYSRLNDNTLFKYLKDPGKLHLAKDVLNMTDDDVHKSMIMLLNSYKRYASITGNNSPTQFALDYLLVHYQYKMEILRQFYQNKDELPECYKYDNIFAYLDGVVRSVFDHDLLKPLFEMSDSDPNFFPTNVVKTNSLEDLYYKKEKTRKITNAVMCTNGCFV